MTRDEAIDVVTQSRLLIESLEILIKQAADVLQAPAEAPKLTIVADERTSDYGDPKNWEWGND